MRVFVTGATGFVGFHVVKQLAEKGYSAVLLVRDKQKADHLFADSENIFCIKGDVTDSESIRKAIENCDAVVHCAAVTPMKSISREQLFDINVEGTRNVMAEAQKANIDRVIYLSSITTLLGNTIQDVDTNRPLGESKMPYGQSKIEAEKIVREFQQQQENLCIVYPGGIIGPETPVLSDAHKALIYRLKEQFSIIKDAGIQQVDVRDLAAFIVAAIEQQLTGRHLLAGHYISWEDLADIVVDVASSEVSTKLVDGWKLRLFGRITDFKRNFKEIDNSISLETMRYATQWPNVPNTPALKELGVELRSVKESFADSIAWLENNNYLK